MVGTKHLWIGRCIMRNRKRNHGRFKYYLLLMKSKLSFRYTLLIIFFIIVLAFTRQVIVSSDSLEREIKASLHGKEYIIDYTREGKVVYVLISQTGEREYGDLFTVYLQKEHGEWERAYENDFKGINPWKIETADIDGCGEKEILIAVKKTTHFDAQEKNRLFIFNYIDGKLVKKWTGSQIAGNWKDFYVGDLLPIKGNELIFIELTEEERQRISVYYWFDFGFLALASSEDYYDIGKLSILDENRIQITCRIKNHKKIILLEIKDQKMVEVIR